MSPRFLLCTDLDRTLLPNGAQPESPGARRYFAQLGARPDVSLAYVSGRSLELVCAAIDGYELPRPDYILADVGSSIYAPADGHWQRWEAWDREIAPDWHGKSRADLARLFAAIEDLELQEAHKQHTFKLSYYVALEVDKEALLNRMQNILDREETRTSLIWSIDEPAGIALLDVLPAGATKKHAIEFLIKQEHFNPAYTVFAGDSGNDLPVLTSAVQSVLVANASDEVKKEARSEADRKGLSYALYIARGGLFGMNGNYSAGIIEGLLHYIPEAKQWLQVNDP